MTILKFLLVVILLLVLIPVVRIGLMMWTMRRTLRDAQEAARRMYGDGPFRGRSDRTATRNITPQGEYADFEELPGQAGSAQSEPVGAPTDIPPQVVEAHYEEI